MADYQLSSKAVEDIANIADYTIGAFGIEQARRYRTGIEQALKRLADNPLIGKSADHVAENLRSWSYGSHIIYYIATRTGILVARILHQRMDVERHPMTDD